MATLLNPYLGFKDDARAAMEFYQQVFGGELALHTFGESGAAEGSDGELIMHARLDTPSGYTLMAADCPPGMEYVASTTAISLSGDDADELRGYWEQLSAGGEITMPMEKQVWGDEFGACTDRFGIPWMVNIGV